MTTPAQSAGAELAAPALPEQRAIQQRLDDERRYDAWGTLRSFLPYLWPQQRPDLRLRVAVSVVVLVLGKLVTVSVPFLYGGVVDALAGDPAAQVLGSAFSLIGAYALARIGMQGLAQLRDAVFAQVAVHAMREMAGRTFRHLHGLSLRFHLERRTGGLQRVIDRGTRGVDSLLGWTLFSIAPTLLEFALVCALLVWSYSAWFALVTALATALYTAFTIAVTHWRTRYRRLMNDADSEANSRAVDSLLNYETVKYFNTEEHEARRFDSAMAEYGAASVKTQTSLSLLNTGQAAIISLGLAAVMLLAADGVRRGELSVGDLVAVNAFIVQLYVPLNVLGTVYRDIQQALLDMEKLFDHLRMHPEVREAPHAAPLVVSGGEIRFENVEFAYDPERTILRGISLHVPAGRTVAVVGPSGAGKSTLARILYRFYDVRSGRVCIDGQDISAVQQHSLRAAIGIVPQDTVLFNDTLRYNIRYGRIGASDEQVAAAARMAQLGPFIDALPQGLDTLVGERGLKLSGGEKQRVAIARTLLKNPPILLLDEATSALDTHTEREIQAALREVSRNRTALVIAHRLSTVVDADQILVLEQGRISERGTHAELLALGGAYASMWNRQKEAAAARETLDRAGE